MFIKEREDYYFERVGYRQNWIEAWALFQIAIQNPK